MPKTHVAYLQAKLVIDRKRRIPDHSAECLPFPGAVSLLMQSLSFVSVQ